MDNSSLVSNPFALMMDPAAVVHAMEHSDRLGRLHRRVCRPLDKPLIPNADADASAFDREVDDAASDVLTDAVSD